jgi:hypothetical protein
MLPAQEQMHRIMNQVGLTVEELLDADDRYVLVAGK